MFVHSVTWKDRKCFLRSCVGRAFPRGHCHHLNPLLSLAANAGLFPFAFPGCRHRVGTRASRLQHLVPQSETRPRPPRRGFFFGAMRIAWWRAAPKERLRLIWRSPCMSLRADVYRQKAAEAKQSAAKATSPSIKRAFEEVAGGWLVLAEQMEWIDRQRSPARDEEK